ncbi:MAG: hypothetical protein QME48_05050 [bacterium]|nr:hypothetical protein [bacterium]
MLDFFSSGDPNKVVEKSSKLRIEGKHEKAEQLLKKNIKNSKSDFIILLELSKTQFEMGKISEAVSTLRNSYYISPEEIDKILNVGEDLHYRATSQKDQTASVLIEMYIKKRDFESLKKIFDTLSSEEIKNLLSYFEKLYLNVKNSKTVDQFNKKDVEIYLSMGILYLYNKNFKEAKPILELLFRTQVKDRNYILSEYLNVAKTTYGNPDPYIAIGDLYILINDKDKAINYFHKASTLDPKLKTDISNKIEENITDTKEISESSKYSIVDLAIEKKDYKKALDIIYEIIKENNEVKDEIVRKTYQIIQSAPDFVEGYKLLVEILLLKKDVAKVYTNLEKIYELKSEEKNFILGVIGRIEQANSCNEDLYILKAKILTENEEFKESAKIIKDVYFKNNSYTFDVEKLANKVLDKDPENIDALETLCQIFLDKGELDKLKKLCEYLLSISKEEYITIAKKYLQIIYEKNTSDLETKLNLGIALVKLGKIKESEVMIIETLKTNPETFYIIVPQFYNAAKNDKDVASIVLKILKNLERRKFDPFLYDFSLCEISYLASDLEFSLGMLKDMFENYPEKEEDLLELLERIKDFYPENELVTEFEFNLFLNKKDFKKAYESLIKLRKDKNKLGHILDNLYILNKNNPEDVKIVESIVEILDEMGFYEKIIKEGETLSSNLDQQKVGKIKFYIGKAYANKGMVNDSATLLYQAIILDKSLIEITLSILKDLLKYDPFSLRVHYTLSLAYYLNKNIDLAIEEMLEIVKIDQNQINIVISEFEKWNENVINNPKLNFSLGTLYFETAQYDKGISKMYETYEMDSSYLDSIINLMSNYIEKESENGEMLYATGVFYSKKGLFKLASDYLYNAMSIETELKGKVISQLQFIINQQPDEVDPRFSLAQVYKDMHNYMQAITLLRQIELINPAETENVISFYKEMLTNEPNNNFLLISLADSYLKTNKIKEAVELYSKIIKVNKKYIDEVIDRILEIENKDVEIQLFLVDLYFEKDDFENASNWLNFLYLTSDTDVYEKIIEKANLIISKDPKNQKIISLLSHIYYDLKKFDKIIELTMEIYEKTTKDDEKIRYGILLAQSFKNLGNDKKKEEILSFIKNLNIDLFYEIIFQFYEEEKSKKCAKIEKMFKNGQTNDENMILDYALNLYKQQRYFESINILNRKFNDTNLDFERIYLLSKNYEKLGNITYALEIASKLRDSSEKKHLNHLINLMKKLGYYGEIEGMLRSKIHDTSFASEFTKTKYYSNLFSDYRIII